jgi:TIR domain.
MTHKYQLIFLGTLGEVSSRITDLFFTKIRDLKLNEDAFLIVTEENFNAAYKGNQPAFAIYFGDVDRDYKSLDILQKLINDGTMILPIYYKQDEFHTQIPCNIHGQNGLLYDPTQEEKIISLILESFELLRSSRKVFVSYKRNESSSIAIQLYEALERSNFDVFLDTHSIKPGDPFQDELWHRMTDCDVIVLLNTKGFLDSKWCKEEIAEASAKQIGIIQLIWPDHKLENIAEICYPFKLTEDDFENKIFSDKEKSKFTPKFLNMLLQNIESVRARNLAARQDNLITEFTNSARKYGKHINLQPERFMSEEIAENTRRIFIPTIGIPQSINCNQSQELMSQITDYTVSSIYLIYDDLRIRDKWLKHLDWLNNYLEVKTIKKQGFDKWLSEN